MRAFIFSLDAFVAFTLALIVIYSLIFFSSVPSAYYFLLTQGHYLSRDILYSLSSTQCSGAYSCSVSGTSLLDNIVFPGGSVFSKSLVRETIGEMVPDQFGYVMEVSEDQGQSWLVVYNTSVEPLDNHAHYVKKLQVSTYVMAFNYPEEINKMDRTPYNYNSCGFGAGWTSGTPGSSGSSWTDWGLITCGELSTGGGSPGTPSKIIGNTPPENLLGGDLVPSTEVKLVKFTIFI
jgi:hypothetical protein